VAEISGSRLIRLQCYEGLDESKALYEWNYKKQLLRIQAERNDGATWSEVEDDIFSDEFPPDPAAARGDPGRGPGRCC
jgi:MoxR-like ATPase